MSVWGWIVIACAACFALKLVGYLLPSRWLSDERVGRVTTSLTIALLAGLVTLNTFNDNGSLVWDAKVVALGAALVALLCRAPFLLVVIIGAVAAVVARMLGMP